MPGRQVLLSQQPFGQVAALHGATQAPATQRVPFEQATQPWPLVPQALSSDPARQVVPEQQPLAQVVAEHVATSTQVP